MNRTTLTIILTLILSLSTLGQSSIKVGSPAPEFSGKLLDGTPLDLNQLKGKVVVMAFWSTRCAICHHERPKMNQVSDRYDAGKVAFIALSMENEEKITGYLKSNPFKFQVVPDSFATVLKYADRDRNGNLDMGFPSYFVVDQNGTIRYRSSGYDKTKALNDAIDRLITK